MMLLNPQAEEVSALKHTKMLSVYQDKHFRLVLVCCQIT